MRDTKETLLYILKRILLMILTLSIIFVISFILIRLLPIPEQGAPGSDAQLKFEMQQIALGRMRYDEYGNAVEVPVIEQLFSFIKNLFYPYAMIDGKLTEISAWGISWKISPNSTPVEILGRYLLPTVSLNFFSMLVSVPIGLALGTYMALKKDKWQDNVLGIVVMLLISVPSFVSAFLIQYVLGFELQWFSATYVLKEPITSLILPVMSMSIGSIAGYARYSRAELTEVLTSDFMLLARTKGLTRAQATVRHAFRNSLVPIFPMILGELISLLSGSMIIEQIFTVPGVGSLFLNSIMLKDYDVFQFVSMFYILIGLVGGLIVDISYGIVDPRIRMGGGK